MEFGEKLQELRKRRGLTQEELSELLFVTPQAISKWERGLGYPDISQIVPLSRIFGISTDALLGAEEDKK